MDLLYTDALFSTCSTTVKFKTLKIEPWLHDNENQKKIDDSSFY